MERDKEYWLENDEDILRIFLECSRFFFGLGVVLDCLIIVYLLGS